MDRYLDCISVENMRESDRLTIENYVSGRTLMYRAAMDVYKAVGWRGNIAIAVGGGNNGGDGYALACILTENDFSCRIVKLSDKLTEDSGCFAERARTLGVPTEQYTPGAFIGADMIVDCLLGTGFQGSLREPLLGAVNEINNSDAEVISVDINSGMNGDTGEAQTAVKSDVTVTIGYVKRGLISDNAGAYMKKLIVADIGIVLAKEEDKICPADEFAGTNDSSLIPAPAYLRFEPVDVSREEITNGLPTSVEKEIKIIKASAEDAEAVALIAAKMWTSHTADELAEVFADTINSPESAVFILKNGDKAVGFAQCGLRHDYVEGTHSSPVGYLEGVFVEEPYRKRGCAKQLSEHCEQWAKGKGCTEFASDCELDNEVSRLFHLGSGFREANRIICFTKKL